MKLIAGVDIGNSTTEVCIAVERKDKTLQFLGSGLTETTGIKGTVQNTKGIIEVLSSTLGRLGLEVDNLDLIRLNEAAPVIGDTAMETITETVITESTMIGHNPDTPGGLGLGIGEIININNIHRCSEDRVYIVVVPKEIDYEAAAKAINRALDKDIKIAGAIVQADEGVLINNRLITKMPIVDEVRHIEKVPENVLGAVEVADTGHTIKVLSNPYGIASIFKLNPNETRQVMPVAKSLIGTRSAVVIRTPEGEVKEKIIPSGTLHIIGKTSSEKVAVDSGAEAIMETLEGITDIVDIVGESGTNIGGMINSVKNTMAELTGQTISQIEIKDILAIDTTLPVKVRGGLADEAFLEKAVAVAAMVKADRLPMLKVAEELKQILNKEVKVAGVEAVMAVLGAYTTPGVRLPIAILDLGGGSTDAALLDEEGLVKSIHLAGAGDLVTMLINSELGLNDMVMAEEIKKHPVAKVESLFHIRMENREIKFFNKPLDAKFFGRNVVLKEDMIPLHTNVPLEKIVEVRRSAKKRVFVENSIRALKSVAPMGYIRNVPNIVLVGGSAMDFEIPQMITEELSKYKIVAGSGNVRAVDGPRNAVATGLVLSYISEL
jgi:diol dehydratase reactivase alpha subunit